MSSKAQILARIRRNLPPASPLPELTEEWIQYADREAQFISVLTSVGGQAKKSAGESQLRADIMSLPCMAGAGKVVCTLPDLGLGNVASNAIADAHALADVDVAIVSGEFGVAENGAVWVSGSVCGHRALLFLAQHLILIVPRSQILDNLHQAYDRLSFDRSGYGVFISGPSKTADIEQSLVIGAHGPRSLTVMLPDSA